MHSQLDSAIGNNMNPRNYGYSLKNIPLPSDNTYLKCLTDKVEHFIRRLRWKAFWFGKPNINDNEDEEVNCNYGFKSTKTPPNNIHLKAFEDELYEMIRNIEFTTSRDPFQSQLHRDVKNIRLSDKVLVFADKSTNLYELGKEEYNKLLNDNITKTYKKSARGTINDINMEAKTIADRLGLSEKMERFAERPAFITLKDHKDDFRSYPKCRLINPAKSEVGHVSKAILEKVIAEVTKASQLNQWRNTDTVINWFKNIKYKGQSRFIKFDVVEFYPSISETLLDKAIAFARTITRVADTELSIIKHARKSLLFNNAGTWIKKGNDLFDVTMGSFDGAEVCELVGLYILDKLTSLTSKSSIGLYRDDGLAVIRGSSGRRFDKLRKDITSLFKAEGLNITIETNLLTTDFLDVTFDLPNGRYYPFRKPGNKPLYINAKSNHPQSITKELPKMISRRISDLSCNEEEFHKAKTPYEAALRESGHDPDFKYEKPLNKRKRNRKVLWFNPPFSKSVKTNVGKLFLQMVKKHFTRQHRFFKIFNSNNIKLSYSCMPNVGNIIKQTNMRTLDEPVVNRDGQCNCNIRENCPMSGECLTSCIAYEATVTAEHEEHIYIGACQDEWKFRFNDHMTSFRKREYEKKSELSKFIWSLHDKGSAFSIKWRIAARARPYKCGTRRCDLCLTEKTLIARSRHKGLLNSRSEIVSKCRHRNKYTLNSLIKG